MPLKPAPRGSRDVFRHTPVAVFLAVLPALVALQVHDARSFAHSLRRRKGGRSVANGFWREKRPYSARF